MPAHAVIFDLDGTLLDTLEDIADSANAALMKLGFPVHDLHAYRYMIGEGIEMLVRRALPQRVATDDFVAACVGAMRSEYEARWHIKTRPYPGIGEVLNALAQQGIGLAVLSNKPDDFTRVMVQELLPDVQFQTVQGARASVPKKPDPAAALQIARSLAVPPQDILFVGDSDIDMQTGLSAGMVPVGVLWGFRTAEELAAGGARVLIRKPVEILDLVGGNPGPKNG